MSCRHQGLIVPQIRNDKVGKGSLTLVGKSVSSCERFAALRKKLQLNGTNLVLERGLLAGHTFSHLLRESSHKR